MPRGMSGMRIAIMLLGAWLFWGVAPAEAAAARQEVRAASAGKTQASPARSAAPRREAARPATRPAANAAPARQAANAAPTRQAARAAPTRQAAQRATATRPSAQRGASARQVATRQQPAACTRRDQRGRCVQQAVVRNVAWQGGLPAASGEQASACPTGTIATLARGHDDIVRCLPI